jgi:homoserine kinase
MQQYTKQQQELIANDVYYQQLISQAEAAGLATAALTEEQARKENEIKKKYRDEDAANRMANIQKGFDMASLALDALSSLNEATAKGDEASQRKAFERNKLMQKAQATIAMAAGIVQQLAVPKDQLTGMNFVKAAAVAAAGVANIVKINQTQFTGGTPPSTSNLTEPTGGGNAPAIDFSGANIANNAPGGLETYVLAGNVANALEARQKIIDQSHL